MLPFDRPLPDSQAGGGTAGNNSFGNSNVSPTSRERPDRERAPIGQSVREGGWQVVSGSDLSRFWDANVYDLEWPQLGFAVPAARPERGFSTDGDYRKILDRELALAAPVNQQATSTRSSTLPTGALTAPEQETPCLTMPTRGLGSPGVPLDPRAVTRQGDSAKERQKSPH